MITDPAVGELPPRAADRVAELLRDPQDPAKLLVTGGIGSGKSAVLAAVRDGLRAAGVPVVTQVRPEVGFEPCGSALVIDDADRLDDGALAALVTVAADPYRTVVVATQPLGQRPELRRLTDVLEHEQTALVLPTRGAPDPDRLRRLDEPLLDALALLSLDDRLGPADIAAALDLEPAVARELVDRAHGTGLLRAPAALHEAVSGVIGAVRHHAVESALLESQLAHGTLGVPLARTLADHGRRDPRLAERLSTAASSAVTAGHPEQAAGLYRAALAAGTSDPTVVFADSLALTGDCTAAAAVADGLLADPGTRADAVRVAAAVACHDGNTAAAAELFDWLRGTEPGTATDPEVGAAAAVVALAAGNLPALRATAAPAEATVPTSAARAARNLAAGLRTSVESGYDAALALFGQSVGAAPTVALPDDPAAVVALAALHSGDPARARGVLSRDAAPAELFAPRHALLTAWTWLVDGNLVAAAALAPHTGLHRRDALWAAALRTGIARRSGDAGALHRDFSVAVDLLAEYSVDVFTLLPLGELWVAGVRMRQADRLRHPLRTAFGLLGALGDPPAWSLPLHWAGVHAAILANNPDAMAPHAAALAAASAGSDFARALAAAGRAWLRVLARQVDPAEVAAAARGLAQFGLTWDATRLTGQAALGTDDPRVSTAMLALARDLKQNTDEFDAPAAEDPEPGTVPSGIPEPARPAALSDREREVAELLLLGMPYRDIGAQLFISAKTVEHHVARIRRRLGAESRSEMLSMLRAMLGA
ncbi:LuxR family transcriptional regulator [Mycolicibacterium insubricum]|uniref:isoniazid response ATPase/transcriptional regulator IniR n=1 Tax=Mycolicibacterium insubricum TaxID=444597 RepID=UPI00138B4F62|nr:isoniazid response ATPase/transcriptional regulator IniR [Mycolicibacterium insubricum]BBZ65507.1 LuxR family transcriptional regulator [Mycolicibacterium insubricum]